MEAQAYVWHLEHMLGRQSWGKWSALRPRVHFMDSEPGAKQARDPLRFVLSDNQVIPALPSLHTAITNTSPLRQCSQTPFSFAVQESVHPAAKLAQVHVRLRW